jgi:hypothetical protein
MKRYLDRFPELQEFLKDLEEIVNKAFRPAEEVVLDESDFCKFLKISKRLAAKLRAERLITYYKSGGKLYYKLSDVLSYAFSNKIPAIVEKLKIR